MVGTDESTPATAFAGFRWLIATVAAVALTMSLTTAVTMTAPVAAAASSVTASPRVVPESTDSAVDWGDLNPGGTRISNAPADAALSVYLGFPSPELAVDAASVSDPDSTSYGIYPPLPLASSYYGASEEDEAAVDAALGAVGVDPAMAGTRTYTRAQMSVAQAERFFGVPFGRYSLPGSVLLVAPDSQPSLPASLDGIITNVYGLIAEVGATNTASDGGPIVNPLQSDAPPVPPAPGTLATPTRTGVPEGCPEALSKGGFAPNQLATAYGIDTLHDAGLKGQGQRLAVLEIDANVLDTDTAEFADCFGITDLTDLRQVNVAGDPDPASPDVGEATLDVQVVAQVAPQLEAFELYSFNGNTPDTPAAFLEMITMPLDPAVYGEAPPDVVSVSYGVCESEFVGASPAVTMTEQVLAMAALSGMSVFVAAGDTGSSGCLRLSPEFTTPTPAYPATSAWVTAVGGTGISLSGPPYTPPSSPVNEILQRPTGERTESVWNDTLYTGFQFLQAGGGGGTSELLPRPAWQTGPGVPDGATRLNPDIAMYADVFPGWTIFCSSVGCDLPEPGWGTIGGTSAASPMAAAITALINQSRAGGPEDFERPLVGFASPMFYDVANRQYQPTSFLLPSALRDVTTASNDVAGVGCCAASVGYDLASGWGSPHAESLKSALAATPNRPSITAATGGYRSAELTVEAPADIGALPITGYEYSFDNGETWQPAPIIGDPSAATVQFTATGLPGGTETGLFVRAVNAAGPGLSSDRFSVSTPGAAFDVLPTAQRVFDSRTSGGPINSGQPVLIDVNAPLDAVAVAYNLTITSPTGRGNAVVAPAGATDLATTSTINWFGANQTVANGYVTALGTAGTTGEVEILIRGGSAQVILDVLGYYVAQPDQASWLVMSDPPTRAYDSRVAGAGGPLAGGQSRAVDLSDAVPAGATAVAYTLTEVGTVGTGHLTVGLPGQPKPATSTINWFQSNQTAANSTVAALDDSRAIQVFAGGGSTNFIVDVLGYFEPSGVAVPSTNPANGENDAPRLGFTAIAPERFYDSRSAGSGGPLSGGQSRTTPIELASITLPTDTAALAVNLTETATVATGHLRLTGGPTGAPPPVSTINWFASGVTMANGTLSTATDLELTTYAGGGSTQYLLDAAGYYTPSDGS